MNKEDKYKNLDRVNFWIANCDTKVSFILALQGILVTILATNAPVAIFRTFSYVPAMDITLGNFLRFLELSSLFAAVFYFISAMYFIKEVLLAKINPNEILKSAGYVPPEGNQLVILLKKIWRIIRNNKSPNSEEKYTSHIFYMTIAGMTNDEFSNPPKNYLLEKDISSQIYINSHICTQKFQNYNKVIGKCAKLFICSVIYIALNTIVQLYFNS